MYKRIKTLYNNFKDVENLQNDELQLNRKLIKELEAKILITECEELKSELDNEIDEYIEECSIIKKDEQFKIILDNLKTEVINAHLEYPKDEYFSSIIDELNIGEGDILLRKKCIKERENERKDTLTVPYKIVTPKVGIYVEGNKGIVSQIEGDVYILRNGNLLPIKGKLKNPESGNGFNRDSFNTNRGIGSYF